MALKYEQSEQKKKHIVCCNCSKKIIRCVDEFQAKLIEDEKIKCDICNTEAIYRGELLVDAEHIIDEKFTPVNIPKLTKTKVNVNKKSDTPKDIKEITFDNYKDIADKHYTKEKAIEVNLIDEHGYPIGHGNKPPINKAIRLAIRFALYENKEGVLNNILRTYSDQVSNGARYFDKQIKIDLKEKVGLDLDK